MLIKKIKKFLSKFTKKKKDNLIIIYTPEEEGNFIMEKEKEDKLIQEIQKNIKKRAKSSSSTSYSKKYHLKMISQIQKMIKSSSYNKKIANMDVSSNDLISEITKLGEELTTHILAVMKEEFSDAHSVSYDLLKYSYVILDCKKTKIADVYFDDNGEITTIPHEENYTKRLN